jgi:hypothetical protein
MPNWTSNRIRAEGEPADLKAFLEAIKGDDTVFDFNRIIPMPPLLRHTGAGHRIIGGKSVASWYIIHDADPLPSDEQVRLFTPEEEAELKLIGHSDWYGWSVVNWGTKWDADRPEIEDTSCIQAGTVEITFRTAWDAPIPVFRTMIRLFPKLSFQCQWCHEDENHTHTLDIDQEAA